MGEKYTHIAPDPDVSALFTLFEAYECSKCRKLHRVIGSEMKKEPFMMAIFRGELVREIPEEGCPNS